MLRLAFDFIITWRETRTRPNAYGGTASPPEWDTKRRHIKIQSFQPSAPSFNAH